MDPSVIPEWSGDAEVLRRAQQALAGSVVLKDGFARTLRTVAGFDVAFDEERQLTLAAAVLLDADSLAVIESQVVQLPTRMPHVPGLLSFRAVPALLTALEQLSVRPDLAFVDGQGLAHPHRLGVASHFGVAADLPTVGVAKRIVVGTISTVLHDMRGAFTTLRDDGQHVGWLLRTRAGHLPLIVSPGHRVAMASAPELVMRFVTTHRLPEPTRLANELTARPAR